MEKGDVIIYRNKTERLAIMKKLNEMGYVWSTGKPIPEYSPTCYDVCGGGFRLDKEYNTVMFGSISWFEGFGGYKLIPADKFLGEAKRRKPIVITMNGRKVTAEDKATGDKGVAICGYDDDFDFYTGATIALARLMSDCNISDDVKAEWKKLFGEEAKDPKIEAGAYTGKIKVGDKVRIKLWDTMKFEYETDLFGDICHEGNFFTSLMSHLCGRTATVKGIDNDTCGASFKLDFDDKSGDTDWLYYDWMLEKGYEPENPDEIKVGDRVVVKSWDEMADAYTKCSDCIYHNGQYFTDGMKMYCGLTATVTDTHNGVNDDGIKIDLDNKNLSTGWNFSAWMFKKIEDIKVGDTVKVVDSGKCYRGYDTWVKKYVTDPIDAIHYSYGQDVPDNDDIKYEVLYVAAHETTAIPLCYIRHKAYGDCYLVAMTGLEKV